MNNLLLFAIAIIPVILISKYVHGKDKNKEPVGLLALLFLAGVASCFLVVFISMFLTPYLPFMQIDTSQPNNFLDVLLYSFVGVALIEESCKFLMTYAIGYRNRSFDEVYDIVVYSVFVALGFAGFENILYVFQNGIVTGILRAVLAVPGHACDGLFMGYYLSLAKISHLKKNKESERNYIIKSIFVPVVLHGIYDFCCFSGNNIIILVFVVFVIAMYCVAIKKLNLVAKNNRNFFTKKKNSYDNTEATPTTDTTFLTEEIIKNANADSIKQNNNSEYFTVVPRDNGPNLNSNSDNFTFGEYGVPYVPDLSEHQTIDYAPITKEQSAEYIPELPINEFNNQGNNIPQPENIDPLTPEQPLVDLTPEHTNNYQPEQSELPKFCVYCGAELTGPFCSSCGHKVKE